MPGRGRPPRNAAQAGAAAAHGAAAVNANDDNNEEKSSNWMKLPKLTSDNYNEWERRMKHLFYAKEWEAMEAASRQAPGPAVPGGAAPAPPRADDIDAAERRKAWGVLMASLNTEMLSKLDGVGLGEVEEALRILS